MKKSTVRILFKWSYVINAFFIIAAILDFVYNDSALIVPLIIAYLVFIFLLILLYIIGYQRTYVVEECHEIGKSSQGPQDKKTVVYDKER
ncbi:MAG: hypothetical protein PHH26_02445 [Candidatus Thermoplasmatota archaeon]|nr:hypothetical protein [Candidatus Thermoplasmatota archaeon]